MLIIHPSKVHITSGPSVVGLPSGAFVEYFGILPDGRQFVIGRPESDWGYTDFFCVANGKSVLIESIQRARDGGTTDIATAIGRFHFPAPLKPEEKPTFNGEPIEVMQQDTHDPR